MSQTRGGANSRSFTWALVGDSIRIENENRRIHTSLIGEILRLLQDVEREFGDGRCPLANNVEKLAKGTEKVGWGSLIFRCSRRDTTHAQGSSYLGVVLEESGIVAWNSKHNEIAWRLVAVPANDAALREKLSG